MTFDPASAIQDFVRLGEFGDVNPSITDSSTFVFSSAERMKEIFSHEIEGCFLYSRHWNPINKYLSQALAAMEDTETAQVTASGMSAISCTILQLCGTEDEVISSRTVYGGTYALFKNLLPRFGIRVRFVDLADRAALEAAAGPRTRVLYTESMSNPLLEVVDLPSLSEFARARGLTFVVDNTFTPMILTPKRLGADVVIHSLTKFINGTSDTVAGCICGTRDFIARLTDVNSGACMLLGPVLDSLRASSLLKNLHSLHVRISRHSRNSQSLAERLRALGLKVHYPGLPDHAQHALLSRLMNPGFGFGGMLTLDLGDETTADRAMGAMQEEKVGYLAVSLGYFKTLFSAPGHSTSSEIPEEEQEALGLSPGLVRFSVGLDDDIERTAERIRASLERVGVLNRP